MKKFIFRREEEISGYSHYEMQVDEKYLEYINNEIKGRAELSKFEFIPLTIHDLFDIIQQDDSKEYLTQDRQFVYRSFIDENKLIYYTDSISDIVRQIMNDDIWDYYTDSDTDGDGYSDTFIVEEND